MKKLPLVSIIMNCFNGQEFLDKSINSVINQTYSNWELIIWDNQSNDKSYEVIKKFKDSRIRYFYADSHTNLYNARGLAVKKSKGDFIAFLDVDDWWCDNKLECQIPIFENENIGLVYSNFYRFNQNKNNIFLNHKKKLPSGNVSNILLKNYNIGWLTVVIRKNFYENLQQKFNPKYNIIGDFDLNIRLSLLCEFYYIDKATAYCRWHGNNLQITQEKKHIEELDEWINDMKHVKEISSLNNFKLLKNKIEAMSIIYLAKNGHKKESLRKIRHINGFYYKIKIIFFIILPKKIRNLL